MNQPRQGLQQRARKESAGVGEGIRFDSSRLAYGFRLFLPCIEAVQGLLTIPTLHASVTNRIPLSMPSNNREHRTDSHTSRTGKSGHNNHRFADHCICSPWLRKAGPAHEFNAAT